MPVTDKEDNNEEGTEHKSTSTQTSMPKFQHGQKNLDNNNPKPTPQYVVRHDKILGQGSYSIVNLASHKPSQQTCAAKIVDLRLHKPEFDQEVDALTSVNHPNIISCLHHEISHETGTLFLEFLPHPSLFKFIQIHGPCPERLALDIFYQIVDAVSYLHTLGISHGDLKPENLSFDPDSGIVKLFDFGLSETVNPLVPISENYAGSPLYMAPEVLTRERHNPFLADVWSLGMVLFEILASDSPFSDCSTLDQLMDRVCFENRIQFPSYFSLDVQEMLNSILNFNPAGRPSAEQVRMAVAALRSVRNTLL